jgi:hypothetical protein
MDTQIEGKMVASRVCDAIARIGYCNHAAIMDIVDNSVTAAAKKIRIQIRIVDGLTFNKKSNISSITIIDDGIGMDDSKLLNALDIGSVQDYDNDSLSKYGLGLKSAGFSLGPKISVLSKKENLCTSLYYVDRRLMTDKYYINKSNQTSELEELIEGSSGSVIHISDCQSINHPSAKKTVDELSKKMGVTYEKFLSRKNNPLEIYIEFPDIEKNPTIKIPPKDILFKNECYSSFDKDSYDCKKPVLVIDKELPVEGTDKPIRLEVVLFPMQRLATQCVRFTDAERAKIKEFEINSENKGFFIYRNDRLISWGDNFDGLITKDDHLFRARISLSTEHDDSLHVDVSKQRLNIPEDLQDAIERHTANPLNKWQDDIRELCNALLAGEEGQQFNEKNQSLEASDDDSPAGAEEQTERKRRKKIIKEDSEKKEQENNEKPDLDSKPATELPIFKKTRYSDKITGGILWEMGYDETDGVFVRINTNHNFYISVLSKLPENDPVRQAIEGILWAKAAGELMTTQNLTSVKTEEIESVIKKFKKTFSSNLDSWCEINQDLFDA